MADNPVSRRGFFRRFVQEVAGLAAEARSGPQMRPGDLQDAPESLLRTVVPVLAPQGYWRVEGKRVVARHGQAPVFVEVFRLDGTAAAALSLMDGVRTLEDVATGVLSSGGGTWDTVWPRVCELFKALADRGICRPAGGHLAG